MESWVDFYKAQIANVLLGKKSPGRNPIGNELIIKFLSNRSHWISHEGWTPEAPMPRRPIQVTGRRYAKLLFGRQSAFSPNGASRMRAPPDFAYSHFPFSVSWWRWTCAPCASFTFYWCTSFGGFSRDLRG
jgi:hypothetical protein